MRAEVVGRGGTLIVAEPGVRAAVRQAVAYPTARLEREPIS